MEPGEKRGVKLGEQGEVGDRGHDVGAVPRSVGLYAIRAETGADDGLN